MEPNYIRQKTTILMNAVTTADVVDYSKLTIEEEEIFTKHLRSLFRNIEIKVTDNTKPEAGIAKR